MERFDKWLIVALVAIGTVIMFSPLENLLKGIIGIIIVLAVLEIELVVHRRSR